MSSFTASYELGMGTGVDNRIVYYQVFGFSPAMALPGSIAPLDSSSAPRDSFNRLLKVLALIVAMSVISVIARNEAVECPVGMRYRWQLDVMGGPDE